MKKQIYILVILSLVLVGIFSIAPVQAEDFSQAQQIIAQNVPCNQLNSTQLSEIGDYYIEQIHPGEQHEYMDAMMGGEGSQSLEQMHIAMAYRFYCEGDTDYSGYGMMGMMFGYGNNSLYQNQSNNTLEMLLGIFIATVIILIAILLIKDKK